MSVQKAKSLQYINSTDYNTPGICTSLCEMNRRLETQEEAQKREKNEKTQNSKYSLLACAETEFKIVKCTIEQYCIKDGYDNYSDIIRPGELGYWEYAIKKGLIEGYDTNGNKV